MHSDPPDIPPPDLDLAGMKAGADGEADLSDGRAERQRTPNRSVSIR